MKSLRKTEREGRAQKKTQKAMWLLTGVRSSFCDKKYAGNEC